MGERKRKTVFTAEPRQLEQIDALIRQGKYRTTSEFVRAAIDEKLAALRHARLAEQVARYCDAGHADEDIDLIASQAFDEET